MATANPQQAGIIQERENSRKIKECFIKGQHVSLDGLKAQNLMIEHLGKQKMIPTYQTPVEFWVSDVVHVTEESEFIGILASKQFRPPKSEFSWWNLKINEEEIRAAETRYMERNFPNQAQELNEQESFLKKFTSSPQFQLETSDYGNYLFTFPLTGLMQWYKEQNCDGEDPVLRVYETIIYNQEIVYTVLIHSPENNHHFKEYPLLETSDWVRYQDGKIIWKAQAIFEFYVWDRVSLVFHLPNDFSIKIPRQQLIEALSA